MEFSRQEYWSGSSFPSPGDLPDSGIKPQSPALQANSLPSEPPGKPRGIAKVQFSVRFPEGDLSTIFSGKLAYLLFFRIPHLENREVGFLLSHCLLMLRQACLAQGCQLLETPVSVACSPISRILQASWSKWISKLGEMITERVKVQGNAVRPWIQGWWKENRVWAALKIFIFSDLKKILRVDYETW